MNRRDQRWDDCIAPIDFRYWDPAVAKYLSEQAFVAYKLEVEAALIAAFERRSLCSAAFLKEVREAIGRISTDYVYDQEGLIKHDIRALVNCLTESLDRMKPHAAEARFIHLGATSFDIVETANAARFKAVMQQVVRPALISLETTLIALALREAETLQIGRTHGQHAVPITFGFALAEYVNRLGDCIVALDRTTASLVGKFSGAVGSYNAMGLVVEDPEELEREVLANFELVPALCATQITPFEPTLRLLQEVVTTGGVLANLARDMRNLQRSEISEVGEEFGENQVGSSTMPHKRNPISFENAESQWKILVGRLMTVMMDQLSDHQRDLTGSASGRTYGEMIAYLYAITMRLDRTMRKLQVDALAMQRNLNLEAGTRLAEPLYIVLSRMGLRDAHEAVRQATQEARELGLPLSQFIRSHPTLGEYWKRMAEEDKALLTGEAPYTGLAAKRTRLVATEWAERLGITP